MFLERSGRRWIKFLCIHIWGSSFWLGSKNQMMNQQSVCGIQRQAGQYFVPQCLWRPFHIFSRVIRFDNQETRPVRQERDKLAAIRTLWDKWVNQLPLLCNPGPNFTVDERLVVFRVHCSFRQYMPSKTS